MDTSELAATAPEWAAYAATWTPPVPPAGATPQQIRAGANRNTASLMRRVLGVPEEGLVVTDVAIASDGAELALRLYTPTSTSTASSTASSAATPLPVYLHLHGGGYFLGNLDTEDAMSRHTALQTGAAVLSVDYRKTPEHVFPAAVHDAWAAYQWAVTTGSRAHNLDPRRVVVGGVSAGATLAIAVALRALAGGSSTPPVTGLVLTTPATVHPDNFPGDRATSSLTQCADAPFLSAARLRGLLDMYRPTPTSHADVSPLLLPPDTFAHLAPAGVVVHVAGRDPLRDEGLLFEQKLQAAGVKTTLYTYPGLPHAFVAHPALPSAAVWRQRTWTHIKTLAEDRST